jgi:hypothetical protein
VIGDHAIAGGEDAREVRLHSPVDLEDSSGAGRDSGFSAEPRVRANTDDDENDVCRENDVRGD